MLLDGRLHGAAYNIKNQQTHNSNNVNLNAKIELLESEINKINKRTFILEEKVEIVEHKTEMMKVGFDELKGQISKHNENMEAKMDTNLSSILQAISNNQLAPAQQPINQQTPAHRLNGPPQPFSGMEV